MIGSHPMGGEPGGEIRKLRSEVGGSKWSVGVYFSEGIFVEDNEVGKRRAMSIHPSGSI